MRQVRAEGDRGGDVASRTILVPWACLYTRHDDVRVIHNDTCRGTMRRNSQKRPCRIDPDSGSAARRWPSSRTAAPLPIHRTPGPPPPRCWPWHLRTEPSTRRRTHVCPATTIGEAYRGRQLAGAWTRRVIGRSLDVRGPVESRWVPTGRGERT